MAVGNRSSTSLGQTEVAEITLPPKPRFPKAIDSVGIIQRFRGKFEAGGRDLLPKSLLE
jgi:hypothetical protein